MNDTITNTSGLQYNYKIDPGGSSQSKSISSNSVITELVTPKLTMIKTVDKTYATIGDTLNYTVNLTNGGNILLTDIQFKDILPTGAKFVPGSVKINDVAEPSFDVVAGFTLGNMIILGTKKITFQATVESLPTPNTIVNKATSTYNYLVVSLLTGFSESNTVTTTVNITNLEVVKSANVAAVQKGDELTYTIVVTNRGNIDATSITFTDTIDSQLSFVSDSVTVNGEEKPGYNPVTGFALNDMIPSAVTTIVFKTTVL